MAVNRILGRLDSLITMGEKVLGTLRGGEGYSSLWADGSMFTQWQTSSLAFLNTFPSNYIYYDRFKDRCNRPEDYVIKEGVAILRAAKDDIEGGHLQKVETLVSASVFSDFLEMAEYLLENGYKDPAASLTGAVLENGLKRICVNNGITLKAREDISSLNLKLAQNKVYNPLQQKQIQVWNDIRNNADHGHFDEYKTDDVTGMLRGVRNFLSEHLK